MGTKRNVYALLVGIDEYAGSVPNLHGCKNDIAAVQKLLEVRVSGPEDTLHVEMLLDEQATRAEVIARFRAHLSQAGPDDVALFYYSGHGSQEPAPEQFWPVEPDHLDETLVLHDSRLEGQWDLADKELAALLGEIGAKHPHIAVILDCCHSGSGTRAALEDGTAVRRAPTDRRNRPINSFLFAAAEAGDLTLPAAQRAVLGDSGWALPDTAHVLLAACRSNETAKEVAHDGQSRGALSIALVDALSESGTSMTYRDLHRQVSANLRGRVREQNPQLEAAAGDLDLPFLGGTVSALPASFVVTYQAGAGWLIDGGQMHGVAGPAGDETTRLSILDGPTVLATATVTAVRPGDSSIAVTPDDVLDTAKAYRAVITATPLPPALVRISGVPAKAAELRAAMSRRDEGGGSLLAREAAAGETAAIDAVAFESGFRLAKAGSERPLAPFAATSDNAIATLEHIAQWTRLAGLRNGATRLAVDSVRIVLDPEAVAGEQVPVEVDGSYRLEYVTDGAKPRPRKYTLTITNDSADPVWVALLDLTDTYGIYSDAVAAGSQELASGESLAIKLAAEVPDELWALGAAEASDLLKLVVSTAEFDPRNLNQPDLAVSPEPKPAGVRGIPASTLDRLLQRVGTRRAKPAGEDEPLADWFTRDLMVTAVRPRPGVDVSAAGPVELAPGVRIMAHASFDGSARLSGTPDATRDLDSAPVPPLLAEYPEGALPFGLTLTRGTEAASDAVIIEASDTAARQITSQAPLVLVLDQKLGVDEHVLPFAWDGEFYVPLGFSRSTEAGTEIVLQRLSAPVVTTRSLFGSIRILFRKIVGKRVGLPYKYPLLRSVSIAANGTVTYDDDPAAIKAAVDKADAVLLYVHGIIGDTEGMARSSTVTGVQPAPALIGQRYGAILTFDYENINTHIADNAAALRERLNKVGLDDRHGKRFDIVAHSMGGLVSRQLIEFVGGVKVTNLVTLGTPNGGSPWPVVQKWATAVTALAINSLTVVTWPLTVLAAVLSTTEKLDDALDDMEPGSTFLKALYDGPDPGMPYTVIVGSDSLLDKQAGRKLIAKVIGVAADLAFFGEPNDLAVAVTSARNLPDGRNPEPRIQEIACDHVTFFATEAGLAALAEALP